MALDLPLPRNILVHGHWTINREKMSKSTGNVVNPFFAIDRFGVDTMRFFLISQGPRADDSDYDNDFIVRDYKKWLQHGLGNLLNRFLGLIKWNLSPILQAAQFGDLPEPTTSDKVHQEALQKVSKRVAEHMGRLDTKAALREIMKVIEKV
jgi:methionyl-tRNA synthetase